MLPSALLTASAYAISTDFGAEPSWPASLLCTLRTHQSPGEWQHSLPACSLALAGRDSHPLDFIKWFPLLHYWFLHFHAYPSATQRAPTLRLACSPSRLRDPLHRRLQQLRCLRRCFDCYRVARTSSRAGLPPAVDHRLFTAHPVSRTNQMGVCRVQALDQSRREIKTAGGASHLRPEYQNGTSR